MTHVCDVPRVFLRKLGDTWVCSECDTRYMLKRSILDYDVFKLWEPIKPPIDFGTDLD